jgi:enoyl-CoA hydratase/carnithine racemase
MSWRIPTVLREDRGSTAVVTIRRPKVLNALDRNVFDQIHEVFRELKDDPAITSVVLTGFGVKAFVSGADVRFLAAIRSPEEGVATSKHSQAVVDFIEDLGKPVVCALNGLAFGGGLEIAMACTARICVPAKVLGAQPEPNLGIIPGAGGTQRLPRLIGIEPAAELLRTGRTFGSDEAVQLGLCLEEVAGDLEERAVQLARELASGATTVTPIERGPLPGVPKKLIDVAIGHLSRAVDAILCRVILEGAKLPLPKGLELEAKGFGEVCGTHDMRIGVENFMRNGPRSKATFAHG